MAECGLCRSPKGVKKNSDSSRKHAVFFSSQQGALCTGLRQLLEALRDNLTGCWLLVQASRAVWVCRNPLDYQCPVFGEFWQGQIGEQPLLLAGLIQRLLFSKLEHSQLSVS